VNINFIAQTTENNKTNNMEGKVERERERKATKRKGVIVRME
jgi:hypothetical protein